MIVEATAAFVLHRRPYRETGLLIEAFCRERGRVGLVVPRLAQRSERRSLLQPFVPVLIAWRGRGELGTLTRVEAFESPIALAPERMLSGLYLNELLLRLLPRQDPHPALFAAYRHTLSALADDLPQEPVLRCFEVCLLAELGYGLQLDSEADSGQPLNPEVRYHYQLDRGPVADAPGGAGILITGRSLRALADGELNEPAVLREVKRLTRAAIDARLDRPLKTRQMMRALHRRDAADNPNPTA